MYLIVHAIGDRVKALLYGSPVAAGESRVESELRNA
jgi:hypothetical protein